MHRTGWLDLRVTLLAAAAFVCSAGPAPAQTNGGLGSGGTVSRYADPAQQTDLNFGDRSHWLQPWRAYEDTPSTAKLRAAVGINLNVSPDQAEAVCAHLERNGFVRVRIEFGWGSMNWDDPPHLNDPAGFEKIVGACKRHHLRPLFLLNAHHGGPCPMRSFDVHLTAPAAKGDRVIHLSPADAAQLVPGRSGLARLTEYIVDEVIFTHIDADGTVTLSKPLPRDLPAGPAAATTLKYEPFHPAKTPGGTPDPAFEQTLAGWLAYVQAIGDAAKRVFGVEGAPDAGFDFEVWNELTFGSNFLSVNNYYDPPLTPGQAPLEEILSRTVAYVRDPAHDLPGVGIGDGFNNQWPWGSGTKAPPGLTAIDKHPYAGAKRFGDGAPTPRPGRPLDATGKPMGKEIKNGWIDDFVPSYVAFLPEYGLTALQTEHGIRDISPITTNLYDTPHGRFTHPTYPDGRPAPAPEFWITEVNLDPMGADPGDLAAYTAATGSTSAAGKMSLPNVEHLRAKAILRYLVSYVNKGLTRFYFFAARDDNPWGLGLVSRAFFDALKAGRPADPDDPALTSPTMLSVRRLTAAMAGGDAISHPRPLSVVSITEKHGHRQFDGDPATAGQPFNPRPPLYDRDCVAVFPFQASDRKHVVAVYVMTRDMAHVYRPESTAEDTARFDLPEEAYRITIGGLAGGTRAPSLSLLDPLTGKATPVRAAAFTHDGKLTVDLPLTDSPRLLTIEGR